MRGFGLLSLTLVAVLAVMAVVTAAPTKENPSGTRTAAAKDDDASKTSVAKPGKARTKGKSSRVSGFTPAREAAALTFLREHHPELAKLIPALKKSNPAEYHKAVRDVFRVSERLVALREKNPRRYKVELKIWKLNSRLQVLAARLKMHRDPRLERELRQTLEEYTDAQIERLEEERQRHADRLQSLETAIEKARGGRAERVEQQLRRLLDGTVHVKTPLREKSFKKKPPPAGEG